MAQGPGLGRNHGVTGLLDIPVQDGSAQSLQITVYITGWTLSAKADPIVRTGFPAATGSDSLGNLAFSTVSANSGNVLVQSANVGGALQFQGKVQLNASGSGFPTGTAPLPPVLRNVKGTVTLQPVYSGTNPTWSISQPVHITEMHLKHVMEKDAAGGEKWDPYWTVSGTALRDGTETVLWAGTRWSYTGATFSDMLTYEGTKFATDPNRLDEGFTERWLLSCTPANQAATISAFVSAHPGHTGYKLRPYSFVRLADDVLELNLTYAGKDTKDEVELAGTLLVKDTNNLYTEGQQTVLFDRTSSATTPTVLDSKLKVTTVEYKTLNAFKSQAVFKEELFDTIQKTLNPHVKKAYDNNELESAESSAGLFSSTQSVATTSSLTASLPHVKPASIMTTLVTPDQILKVESWKTRDSADEVTKGWRHGSFIDWDPAGVDTHGRITTITDQTAGNYSAPSDPAIPAGTVITNRRVHPWTDWKVVTEYHLGLWTNLEKIANAHTHAIRSVAGPDKNIQSTVSTGFAGSIFTNATTDRDNHSTELGYMGTVAQLRGPGTVEYVRTYENPGLILHEQGADAPRPVLARMYQGSIQVYIGQVAVRGTNQLWANLIPKMTFAPLKHFTLEVYKLTNQVPSFSSISGYTNAGVFLDRAAGEAVYVGYHAKSRLDISGSLSFFMAYDFVQDMNGNFDSTGLQAGWFQVANGATATAYSWNDVAITGTSSQSMMLPSATFSNFTSNTY